LGERVIRGKILWGGGKNGEKRETIEGSENGEKRAKEKRKKNLSVFEERDLK